MIATSQTALTEWKKKKKKRDPNIRDDRSNIKCVTSLTRVPHIYADLYPSFYMKLITKQVQKKIVD